MLTHADAVVGKFVLTSPAIMEGLYATVPVQVTLLGALLVQKLLTCVIY